MSASWYDRHILPYLLDFLCSLKPVRRQREKIVPRAEGRVLEIGIGTGLNLRHYDKAKVGKITGLDPEVLSNVVYRGIGASSFEVFD